MLSAEFVDRTTRDMPELPKARRERFARDYALNAYDVDVLTADPALSNYYEHVARSHGDPKAAANWVMGEVLAAVKSRGQAIDAFAVRPRDLASLLDMIRLVSGKLSTRSRSRCPARATGCAWWWPRTAPSRRA